MRETNFIKQKKDKWIELERTMRQQNPDPDKLNDLFVQITDDLSYSRTFYPNRSVRVYLNGLAQQIFYSIYRNKKSSGNKFLFFWTTDLPNTMYQSRKELLIGTLVFWIPFIVGCLSGSMGEEEEFARQLLGNDYIDMTLSNIQSGDPMAVYKDSSSITMFLGIFLNNLVVSFRYFMVGALFSIGSIANLIYFGLFVGAFQYFFYEQGELLPSLLGIWTHGSLEVPAAILAGVGGIVMGKGLVFPGTYSRLQAFILSARKGIKIMIGIIPLILAAAFIESYITRLTDTPNIIRASFITFNFAIVLMYFVVWPHVLNTTDFKKKWPVVMMASGVATLALFAALFIFGVDGPFIITLISIPTLIFLIIQGLSTFGFFNSKEIVVEEEKLQPDSNTNLRFDRIKSSGEIFKDSFIVYRKHLFRILTIGVATAGFFTAGAFLLEKGLPTDIFAYPGTIEGFVEDMFKFIFGGLIEESEYIGQFFNYNGSLNSPLFIINTLVYTFISYWVLRAVKHTHYELTQELPTKQRWRGRVIDFAKVALVVLIANLLLLAGDVVGFFKLLFIVSFPFLLLWATIIVLEEINLFRGISRTFELLFTRIGNTYTLYIILGLIAFMALVLIFSPIMMFFLQNLGYNLSANQDTMDQILVIMVTFLAQTVFGLIYALVVIGFGLLYYSQVEIRDAKSLFVKIQEIGARKRIRGLEREG